MENIYQFLNQQSDGRLVLFAIVFVVSIYYIMQGLSHIFNSIFKKK